MKVLQEKIVNVVSVNKHKSYMKVNSNRPSGGNGKQYECKKCGYRHRGGSCPAYGKSCAKCKEQNHFAKCCPKKYKRVNEIGQADPHNEPESDTDVLALESLECSDELFIDVVEYKVKSVIHINSLGKAVSWVESIAIEGRKLTFKLDTGAEASVLPLRDYKKLGLGVELHKTKSILVLFGKKSQVIPEGVVRLSCSSRNTENKSIEFIVADVDSVPILGLEACRVLRLLTRVGIDYMSEHVGKADIVFKNKDVFNGLGKFPGQQHIELKPNCIPRIHAPRRVPLSLHARLKETLDNLVKRKIVTPVTKPTEWVNSLVIVEKTNGKLRLCLDPRDLNKAIRREHYMIPRAEDIIAKLRGKTIFSVLDMQEGFWQVELDDDSSKLCAFNTPFGRYQFHRLPYGLCSAPEIFQRKNQEVFGEIEGCEIYFDDLIIAGSTIEEHDKVLKEVIQCARKNGIKFNRDKFQFRIPEVKYLGRVISGEGVRPDKTHIKAITDMETPRNKDELLRLLGLSKFLAQYIPNLSAITAPLRELTKKDTEWQWMAEHDHALGRLKTILTKGPVLALFDDSKPVTLQTDASRDGLGACLVQEGHPISYASRSLTRTEQLYAQIEKELLAITFGMEKYHQFTYGRTVVVQTDHKPLVSIVGKDISKVSARLQRLLLRLLKYRVNVTYVPGKQMWLADTLSRAFLKDTVEDDPELAYVVHAFSKYLPMSPDRKKKFLEATREDRTLVEVGQYFANGWPADKKMCSVGVRSYFGLQDRISVEEGLVFLEDRLIVPRGLRRAMLEAIHESHLGANKCKSRARQILYWPGMSADIQEFVSGCQTCERYRRANGKETMLGHPVPDRPWQRLATDICQFGPYEYLVVMDYYTRWIEVVTLPGKTACEVIAGLRSIFARFGIPEVLVSDNMPFDSFEFKKFASEWDFQSVTSSPLYPQANGLAEKAVSILKNMLRRASDGGQDIYVSLMEYRNTPLADTGVSPAQLMLSRRLRTKLPTVEKLLRPKNFDHHIKEKLVENKSRVKGWYDRSARDLVPLEKGERVVIKKGLVWEPGCVVHGAATPRSYVVRQRNGEEIRRNRKMLRRSSTKSPLTMGEQDVLYENNPKGELRSEEVVSSPDPSMQGVAAMPLDHSEQKTVMPSGQSEQEGATSSSAPIVQASRSFTTRSGRIINKPPRFQ